MPRCRWLILLLVYLVAVGCSNRDWTDAQVAQVKATVEKDEPGALLQQDDAGQSLWRETRLFYRKQSYTSAWIRANRPTPQMESFLQVLQGADTEGLDPHEYGWAQIDARLSQARGRNWLGRSELKAEAVAPLDVAITVAFLKFASHLGAGKENPNLLGAAWSYQRKEIDPSQILAAALGSGDIVAALQTLAPSHLQYALLKRTLAEYHSIARRGGWLSVGSQKLQKGDSGQAVAALSRRLAAEGDLGESDASETIFDETVEEGLNAFKARHGLRRDGLLDAPAIKALNVTVQERIRQIELNMDRWRWMPPFEQRHLLVNIPAFEMQVMENGQAVLEMPVIVGKKENKTPLFGADMTYIAFSPYWNIPPKIAKGETVPLIMKDPRYLEKNNIEIVDYRGSAVEPGGVDWSAQPLANVRLRQKPGPKNSLGLVKFMLPNAHDVYLHDTPTENLFSRMQRDFSHGCVRLQDPLALAQYLLRDHPLWTEERITRAMSAGVEQNLALKRKLPVAIVYFTTWVREGRAHFGSDVYGYDQVQDSILARIKGGAGIRADARQAVRLLGRAG